MADTMFGRIKRSRIIRGAVFGGIAAVIGLIGLISIVLLIDFIEVGAQAWLLTDDKWVTMSLVFLFGIPLGSIPALIPGSVGGACIALLLRTLAQRTRVTIVRGALVGLLIGSVAGYLTLVIAVLISFVEPYVATDVTVFPGNLVIAVAAAMGLIVGVRLSYDYR